MKIFEESSQCHCINLRRAANAVTEYYDYALLPSLLTVNQYSLLVNLSRAEPCSGSDLANIMRLERTTLVRNLKPLIAAGYIVDASAPGRRNRELRVTRLGHERIAAAEALWQKAQEEVEARIGKNRLEALTQTLLELENLAAEQRADGRT